MIPEGWFLCVSLCTAPSRSVSSENVDLDNLFLGSPLAQMVSRLSLEPEISGVSWRIIE